VGAAAAAGSGWWRQGRATKAAAGGVEFSYFFMKTEFWVRGRGGRQEAKYPIRKAHVCRKSVLLQWAKKIAQTPKYLCTKNHREAS
jgi:hypothetical protein